MIDITNIHLKHIRKFDVETLMKLSLNGSNSLLVDINNLKSFNKSQLDEFLEYLNLLYSLFELDYMPNKGNFLNLFIDLEISNEQHLNSLISSNSLFQFSLFSFIYLYIFNNKKIKKEIKRRYTELRVYYKALEKYIQKDAIKATKLIKEYKKLKDEDDPIQFKSFIKKQFIPDSEKEFFITLERIYRGIYRELPKVNLRNLPKKTRK